MPLTPENLAARRSGIGASEIAAVVGVSPYATPLDVYERKILEYAPIVRINDDMERGNELESALLAWTGRRLARTVTPNADLVRNEAHPIVVATPDGYEREGGVLSPPVGVVEVKSPGRGAAQWTDPADDPHGAPDYYLLQVQWQLLATGLPRGVLSALVWGRLWMYRVESSPDLQGALLDAAEEFWRHVEARDPPDPTRGSDASTLARLVRQTREELLTPADPVAVRELVETFRTAKAEEEAAEERKSLARAQVCALIGPAAGMDLGGGLRVTWKAARESLHTDWERVARAAGATEEQIAAHTDARPGSRRFLVSESKARAKKEGR